MQSSGTATQSTQPQRRSLAADAIAGLTFAVVNVPQSMAHALLATVNPVLGIYTLLAAMPVAAFFTSSIYMNVSTTSALSVAAADGLAGIPAGGKVEALAVMVLLMGVLQVAAGLLRLGFLVRFVSNAVMIGFLNGVAVLIILGQLGDLTGYDSPYSNRVAQALDLAAAHGPGTRGDHAGWPAYFGLDHPAAAHAPAQVCVYYRHRRRHAAGRAPATGSGRSRSAHGRTRPPPALPPRWAPVRSVPSTGRR